MAFTALDALHEGYEVYPVVDAIGGTSPEAHRASLDRVIQAAEPASWVSLAVELQRDWARQNTVAAIIEIVLTRPPAEGAVAPRAAAARVSRGCRLATRRQPKENAVLSEPTSISIVRPKRDDNVRRTRRGRE